MLPWKRSTFVLVEEEHKPKEKGPAVTYRSLLSSFVHSCPAILPECPLERLGSVFRTKRQKVQLNQEEPTYSVCYLGNAITAQAKGEGCTQEPVSKIWTKSDFGCRSTRMRLSLGPQGLRMAPSEKGSTRPSHAYQLHRITCCATDARHPKVFAWIYRHQAKNKAVVLRCHAVLMSRVEKARAMARLLCEATATAFSEFKRLKRQSDARHAQQQRLGDGVITTLRPLWRALSGKGARQPTAERSRAAAGRLAAIMEEEEDDDRKEESAGPEVQGVAASEKASAQARLRHVLQPVVGHREKASWGQEARGTQRQGH